MDVRVADEDVRDGVALLVVEAVLAVPHPPEVGGRRGRLGAAPAAAHGGRVVGRDLVAAAAPAVVSTNAQTAAVPLTVCGLGIITLECSVSMT